MACFGTLPAGFYITCAGRSDGGGAQIHAIYSTMLYAHCAGLTYLHTPIRSVEHNRYQDPDWARKWEHTFSPGYRELQAAAFDLERMRLIEAHRLRFDFPQSPPPAPTLLIASECHWYADAHADFYSLLLPKFAAKYRRNSPSLPYARDCLMIAVHIRRGDVGESDGARLTPNAVVESQIGHLTRALAGTPHEFHVYSEGSEDQFAQIPDKATMHLNDDVFATFHAWTNADVFVMAKSSFSYVAALLARGVVVYPPMWHAPLEQWVVCGADGSIPPNAFETALSRKMLLRSS